MGPYYGTDGVGAVCRRSGGFALLSFPCENWLIVLGLVDLEFLLWELNVKSFGSLTLTSSRWLHVSNPEEELH